MHRWWLWLLLVLWWPATLAHARQRNHHQPRDLYKVLGVSKSCNDQELRKAYRKACLKAHPDKPGGSEEDFKEVNQAYEVLSNPQDRQRYDEFGHAGLGGGADGGGAGGGNPFSGGFGGGRGFSFHSNNMNNGNHPGNDFAQFAQQFSQQQAFGTQKHHPFGGGSGNAGFGLDDWIRNMMMGGGASQGSRARRPSHRALKEVTRTLSCSLADLFLGKTKTVTLQINSASNNQSSRRREPMTQPQQYTIHLKPGWKAGTKIKFPQRGRNVPPITFIIEEAKHPTLERRDNDLVYRHKIQTPKMKKKSKAKKNSSSNNNKPVKLSVTLPNGQVWQRTVPAERVSRLMKPGETLIVPDLGMPIKDTNERGNLIIEFY